MKFPRNRVVIAAITILALIVLCLFLVNIFSIERISLEQDKLSNSVRGIYRTGFQKGESKMLFTSPSFDASKAVWEEGVSFAFPRSLQVGETMAIVCGSNKYLITLDRVDYDRSKGKEDAVFFVVEPNAKYSVTSNRRIKLGNCDIGWSYETPNSIFVESDDFTIKAEKMMYLVSFPVSLSVLGSFEPNAWSKLNLYRYPWEMPKL